MAEAAPIGQLVPASETGYHSISSLLSLDISVARKRPAANAPEKGSEPWGGDEYRPGIPYFGPGGIFEEGWGEKPHPVRLKLEKAPEGAVSTRVSGWEAAFVDRVYLESAQVGLRVTYKLEGQSLVLLGIEDMPVGARGSRAALEGEPVDSKKIASSADPLLSEAVRAVLERVPEIVHARQEKISQETIDLLVDAYLKSAPTAPARREIEMDNARERARFVEEFPCYSSREVAELAGHEAANASATATRWKKAGRIIGLPWKGSDLYPAFQFSEGRPRPIIGRLIEALIGMSPWQIAFWLTSSNSWLGGAAPLDRLGEEDAVVGAATRESAVLGG